MKQAILIQCHKNPAQINMLLKALNNPNVDIFIHVDKKSNIVSEINADKNIFILPDKYRVDVEWAGFSQIEATLNLMTYAAKHGSYGHYMLCSGQDYPITSALNIVAILNDNPEANFVQLLPSKNNGNCSNNYDKRTDIYYPKIVLGNSICRRIMKRFIIEITGGYNRTWAIFKRKLNDINFFFGGQWVCLSSDFERWIEDYLTCHPEYIEYYKHTNCPDESFFQTLLMNSPFKNTRRDYLYYIDWSLKKKNPKNLDVSDVKKMLASGKVMARKFENEDVINSIKGLLK